MNEDEPPMTLKHRILSGIGAFFTGSDPDVWKLERSMNPYTLRFHEEKIESSYIWHLNKRYYVSNRYLCVFMAILSFACIFHSWILESSTRFVCYMALNIAMMLPMIICAGITYVKVGDRYFVYRNMHWVISLAMFLTSFIWMFGQPLVLLILGDPLILDPVHGLLMFAIFNLSMTTLRYSIVSTSILMLTQLLMCTIGLLVRNINGWNHLIAFLFNNYYPLVVAWLFSWWTARSRENMMRQSFLVRHFQREEALIIQRSRIKLELTEAGMKVLRKHPSTSNEALRFDAASVYSASSAAPSTLCEARHSHGVLQFGNGSPSRWLSLLSFSKPLRSLPSFDRLADLFSSGQQTPECGDDLEIADLDKSGPPETAHPDHKMFHEIIAELPSWILSLPHVIHNRVEQQGFWKKIKDFVRVRICMDSGDEELENRFQSYFNRISVGRFRMMVFFTTIGSITTSLTNIVISKYTTAELVIRLCYLPTVAILGLCGTYLARVNKFPKRAQLLILVATYLIGFSYCFLLFQSHTHLRSIFREINPNAEIPALGTPSISDHQFDFKWLPKSPVDSGNDWIRSKSNANSTSGNDDPSTFWSRLFKIGDRVTPPQNADAIFQKELLIERYISAEYTYVTNFNALVLFCAVAAGAGLRYAYFIIFQIAFSLTVIAASIYTTTVSGFDGQQVRFVLFTVAVLVACSWITRPLESEARKWYLMKYNYRI